MPIYACKDLEIRWLIVQYTCITELIAQETQKSLISAGRDKRVNSAGRGLRVAYDYFFMPRAVYP